MKIKTYVKTRGRNEDYRFIGAEPKESWWSKYGSRTSFEEPTLLIESDKKYWKVYLTGIPSAIRKDISDTIIRFSISFEGESGEHKDNYSVLGLIEEWLLCVVGKNFDKLSKQFDDNFSEQIVEEIFRSLRKKEDINNRVSDIMAKILNDGVNPQPRSNKPSSYNDYKGSIDSKEDCDIFSSFISSFLCNKKEGAAMYLNLIEPCLIINHNSTYKRVKEYVRNKLFEKKLLNTLKDIVIKLFEKIGILII